MCDDGGKSKIQQSKNEINSGRTEKKSNLREFLIKATGRKKDKIAVLNSIIENQQARISELEDAKQYVSDILAKHSYRIDTLDKQLNSLLSKMESNESAVSSILAKQSYDIHVLEDAKVEYAYNIEELKMKTSYLLLGDEDNKPQIMQIVPVFSEGDAIGNDAVAMYEAINEMGISTQIYSERINTKKEIAFVKYLKDMPVLNKKDIVIIHVAAENHILDIVEGYVCKVVICYHNITPPEFFKEYDSFAYNSTQNGLKQIQKIASKIKYCLADSPFNKDELQKMGVACDIKVLPVILSREQYETRPNSKVLKLKDSNKKTIVSVGRIVPNKKIEDIIMSYSYYKKKVNNSSRLILVGKYSEEDSYYKKLCRLIEENEIEDILFTGYVTEEELVGYYNISDIYLCMSEHEGFCVPLIEAMYFKLPIIAYSCTAIPLTLGKAGILINSKEQKIVAEKIDEVLNNIKLRSNLMLESNKRLLDFEPEKIKNEFKEYIRDILEER